MERGLHFVRKRVEGEVQYNDGQFAEIQTNGIEGIEEDILLETIQIHRENTDDTESEFKHRFPVGMWLDILTTIEIFVQPTDPHTIEDRN
ncbi:MAG TPA: hypothetical protein VGG14_03305 [Candidatus Sulfotelmatobacter sp.]